MLKKLDLLCVLILLILVSASQCLAQRKTRVELVQARSIKSDARLFNGARRLIGDVMFKQDSAIMECDSAHFYSDRNMFDAFGHVHLYKLNDTSIDVKADFLRHDGDRKIAHFRRNVILRDSAITLATDSLDYNLQHDIGSYEHKATIVDSLTVLKSVKGFYYHHRNEVDFLDNVTVDHNCAEYQMFTDTLRYETDTKVIKFFGPTEFYNDTNYMYARFGWYNTVTEKSMFKYDALFRNPNQTITCDSISFNRVDESGEAYSNVVATDTAQNLVVTGNYVEVHKDPEQLFVTDSAQIIYIVNGDSLFIHADTMKVCRDTSGQFRTFRAYWHVRAYKSDLQLQTDSIFFSMRDSIAQFFGNPIFWIQGNQITTNYLEAYVKDSKLDKFKMFKTGMIVSPYDSLHFNQIKGREMVGYLRDNDLYKVDVFKSAETLYFPEDDGEIMGMNKGSSTDMTIYLKNRQLSRLAYRSQPKSDMYPIENLSVNEMRIPGFSWHENIRPKSPVDIFLWNDDSNSSADNSRRIVQQKNEQGKATNVKKPVAPNRGNVGRK